jgi:hypothetical protein
MIQTAIKETLVQTKQLIQKTKMMSSVYYTPYTRIIYEKKKI